MKILLTGGSSLTGYWFAEELKAQGHDVLCTLTRVSVEAYRGEKSEVRVARLAEHFQIAWGIEFGTAKFCELLKSQNFDVIGFHGSHIPDYRSPTFNIAESVAKNLNNIQGVFQILEKAKTPFVLTGTLFEQNEGEAGRACEAATPYGLAKGMISDCFRYFSLKYGVPMGKFIIPNPIGPLEDKKFTYYLMDCWRKGEKAFVKTPLYVRDNIPVKLLAKAYASSLSQIASRKEQGAIEVFRPSCYVESQGDFTARMAREMKSRTGWACDFELGVQTDFFEPLKRVNTDLALQMFPQFSEQAAWDELAGFYRRIFEV